MSHVCSSLLMHCMDFRFGQAIKDFMSQNNLMNDADMVAMAGSAKNLVNPETRDFALKQIEISKTLHSTKTIHLMNHMDCGGYGGRQAFADEQAEYDKLTGDLKEARELIVNKWPDLEVKLWLCKIGEADGQSTFAFEAIG